MTKNVLFRFYICCELMFYRIFRISYFFFFFFLHFIMMAHLLLFWEFFYIYIVAPFIEMYLRFDPTSTKGKSCQY